MTAPMVTWEVKVGITISEIFDDKNVFDFECLKWI